MKRLVITKTELTLFGATLDSTERYQYHVAPAIGGMRNPDVVTHKTILFNKTFNTIKGAWAAATPELIDSLGLFWCGRNYNTEYADYSVDVVKE